MNEIRIELGERSYCIHIGEGILERAGELVSGVCRGKHAAIVTNQRIGELYGSQISESLGRAGIGSCVITIPAGERYKNLRTVAGIYEKLVDQKLDRSGVVIGLGGGVVGDMAGFAAATYMRGVDFVQIPTSLLAQVDASIGGKTGVNLSRGKNLVGVFQQPRIVVIDISVLRTLPQREFRAGLAEIIKHAIIQDAGYFDFLERNMPAIRRTFRTDTARSRARGTAHDFGIPLLQHAIARSCEIKADVVRQDERECGLRRILNYGHTAGHAVERLTAYRKYKHGEAVAIGMVTAVLAAREMGDAAPNLLERTVGIFREAGLPYKPPEGLDNRDIVAAMELDKKVTHGRLNAVLVNCIGQAFVTDKVSPEIWLRALRAQRDL